MDHRAVFHPRRPSDGAVGKGAILNLLGVEATISGMVDLFKEHPMLQGAKRRAGMACIYGKGRGIGFCGEVDETDVPQTESDKGGIKPASLHGISSLGRGLDRRF